MNQIRAIQALNKREIEAGISPNASWHVDYRDTAYIYFGGLPYELSEGDVITIFSQFGEPVFLKLVRDKETGKSKGFGWLKYEDQRSTDLAVDNLGGAEIGGRLVRVDHARYKIRDDEDPEEGKVGWEDIMRREGKLGEEMEEGADEDEVEKETARPFLKEEVELQKLITDHDDDDPMKAFLVDEKKKEVEEALRRERRRNERKNRGDKERHHRSHRSRRDRNSGDERREKQRRGDTSVERMRVEEDEDRESRHRNRRDSKDRDGRRDHDRETDRHRDERKRDGSRERRREKRGDRDRKEREHTSRDERRHRDSEERYARDRKQNRSRSPR